MMRMAGMIIIRFTIYTNCLIIIRPGHPFFKINALPELR